MTSPILLLRKRMYLRRKGGGVEYCIEILGRCWVALQYTSIRNSLALSLASCVSLRTPVFLSDGHFGLYSQGFMLLFKISLY